MASIADELRPRLFRIGERVAYKSFYQRVPWCAAKSCGTVSRYNGQFIVVRWDEHPDDDSWNCADYELVSVHTGLDEILQLVPG